MRDEPSWLAWARQLNAIAQAGLSYSENGYDRERYRQVREIAVDMLSRYTETDHTRIRDLFEGEQGYQTPKVDVRAAVFSGDRILMVRERVDGLWSMPGGWADEHTSLRETVIKESREEAGAEVRPVRIVAVIDRRKSDHPPFPFGMYKIFVQCDYVAGEFRENVETLESGFFTRDALPPLSTGRITARQVVMCFEARGRRCHQALFD